MTAVPEEPAVAESIDDPAPRAGVAAGVRWGMLDQGVQVFVRLATNVVLARMIAPRDFGVVALAVVVVNFGLVLSGLGLGSALIQRRNLTDRHVTTAFTTSAVFGVVLAVAVALTSIPAAAFFHEAQLRWLLPLLACTFVFRGLELTPNDMLLRQLQFRSYYLSSTIATLVGCTAAVAAAVTGVGVWALVLMMVVESFIAMVLAWVFATRARVWRPAFGFDGRALRDMLGISGYVTASQFVSYGNNNGDNLIVGRALGATALGYYGFAYRLMILPLQRFGGIISQSAFPAMARVQDDLTRLRSGYITATCYVAAVCFPVTVGIAVASPLAVPLVLGERWRPAVPALQILALAGPLLSANRLTDALFRAIGRANWNFWLNLVALGLHVVAFVVGVRDGIRGVAIAFVVATFLMIVPGILMAARALRLPWWFMAPPLAPIFLATATMAGVAVGVLWVVPDGTPDALELALLGGLAGAVYLGVLVRFAPDLVAEVRSLVRRKRSPAGHSH
ncbi:MAG TPA: lipopolysaccharide biosynthesis protein [Acidimicrobiales bacterium]|nr:lipopolysaccharide biosynthesis protein [Acidimicrobiales bacterium]